MKNYLVYQRTDKNVLKMDFVRQNPMLAIDVDKIEFISLQGMTNRYNEKVV